MRVKNFSYYQDNRKLFHSSLTKQNFCPDININNQEENLGKSILGKNIINRHFKSFSSMLICCVSKSSPEQRKNNIFCLLTDNMIIYFGYTPRSTSKCGRW